jgi:hypothetical protein
VPSNDSSHTAARWIAAASVAAAVGLSIIVANTGVASADVPGLETKVASGTANANSIKTLAVGCSTGKKALGGGFEVDTSGDVQVIASAPNGATGDGSDNGSGWVGAYKNNSGTAKTVWTWVVCASIGP